MRKCIFHLWVGFLLVPVLASAADSTLRGISRGAGGAAQLVLELSSLPVYRLTTSGQRLDLVLSKTVAADSLSRLPEDDVVVRVILAQKGPDLMVSFLLRRPPSRAQASTLPGQNRITIDLSWDQVQGGARPAIAFTIPGLPGVRAGGGTSVPGVRSVYAGRWEAFFREYHSPMKIAVPLQPVPPELPNYPFRQAGGELGNALESLAKGADWAKTLNQLQALAPRVPPGGEGEAHFQALQAEALVRTGAWPQAIERFKRLSTKPLPQALRERVDYLQAFAHVASGRADLARALLSELLSAGRAGGALRPYAFLLRSELALGAGEIRSALAALDDERVVWPAALQGLRDRRRADALVASGEVEAALAIYRPLLERPGGLADCAFTLYQAAQAFAAVGDERSAQKLYGKLGGDLRLDGATRALAQVAEAYLLLRLNEERRAKAIFWKQVNTPHVEAAARSRLKLFDFDVLSGGDLERRRASAAYGEVAIGATQRALREEAALKQALSLYLLGDLSAGIVAAGRFVRDFGSGPLAPEGQALLREMIPKEVARLIGNQEDLQALVLVEQHRSLLVNDTMTGAFLLELGRATSRLGLFDRASKVYLYLLDAAAGRPEEETYYLPFLETAFDRGEYDLVRTYALRHLSRFPKGKDRARVFYLQLRAMQQSQDLEGAAALLKTTPRPKDDALEVLATEIFWALGRYDDVADCFGGATQAPVSGPPAGLILKAEALCKLGREAEARPIFQYLMGQEAFADQATFRYGELHLSEGRRREGFDILRRLAAEGKSPLWRKLAQESLVREKL